MDIQYVGHSCFRLRGKEGIVLTDPFANSIGFPMPSLRADVVTVSHHHFDHDNVLPIKPTSARQQPFVIDQAGEYEISGISVYGYPSFHDSQKGSERGRNLMFSIFLEDVHILHLGDLGHTLDQKDIERIPDIDILLCPVGGEFTINTKEASEVISALEPNVIIPMHYRTPQHSDEKFAALATVEDFCKEYGKTSTPVDKFSYSLGKGDEEAETQLVILNAKVQGE